MLKGNSKRRGQGGFQHVFICQQDKKTGIHLAPREERQLVILRLADLEDIPVDGGFSLLFGLPLSLQAAKSLMQLHDLGA